MADKDKTKNKKGKDKAAAGGESESKGKKSKGKSQTAPEPYSSIATHPRASGSVKRARARTGLIAFAIAAILSFKANVPIDQVGMRALAAGAAGYMIAWWASMQVWRHLMIAEQKAAIEEIKRRREQPKPDTATL
jgi:hypothetical protein